MSSRLFIVETKRRFWLFGAERTLVAFEQERDALEVSRRSSTLFAKSSVVSVDLVASAAHIAEKALEEPYANELYGGTSYDYWRSSEARYLGESVSGRYGAAGHF